MKFSLNTPSTLKFKQQFKSLTFYSMPDSILFAVRKRLNLIFFWIVIFMAVVFSIL